MASGSTIETSLASELRDGEISYARLSKITDNFSKERELGAGALGKVYLGKLEGGLMLAVKKYVENAPGTEDIEAYKAKVKSLREHNHDNVVRLLAFCYDKQSELIPHGETNTTRDVVQSLLCFEYLHKGSLHKNLFGESANILKWSDCFKIIKGICEGIRFLHELSPSIVHLDLKPQNILLTDSNVPKITDFAYSRLMSKEVTRSWTMSSGSIGYKAPEYLFQGEISVRTDIYSLGIMILEIVTRNKNCPNIDEPSARNYIKQVKAEWTDNDLIMRMYPGMQQGCRDQLNACIEIGLNCVGPNQYKRYNIAEILSKLNGK